jgi:hypothetical protein
MAFPEDHLEKMVDHYAKMATQPGWLDYTRQRVSELQKEDKMYADLGIRVKKRMEELKHEDHP